MPSKRCPFCAMSDFGHNSPTSDYTYAQRIRRPIRLQIVWSMHFSMCNILLLHRLIIALFNWGRKWPPIEMVIYTSNFTAQTTMYVDFYNCLVFIETINYKTGPCVIRRSINMILKKVHFFSKHRFGDV